MTNHAKGLVPKIEVLPPIVLNPKEGSIMVLVPEGTFIMGSGKDNLSFDSELPRHEVNVPAFYSALFPITNRQYKAFVDATGTRPPNISSFGAPVWSGNNYPSDMAQHPVTCTSWADALTYCRWAGLMLPSEAMWEKAARGLDGRQYSWGNEWDSEKLRWSGYRGGGYGLAAVTEYAESAGFWGVYQALGNINEWVSSLFAPYPYDATDGREDPAAKGYRVLRGGPWQDKDRRVFRCSSRAKALPDSKSPTTGFRVALPASEWRRLKPRD